VDRVRIMPARPDRNCRQVTVADDIRPRESGSSAACPKRGACSLGVDGPAQRQSMPARREGMDWPQSRSQLDLFAGSVGRQQLLESRVDLLGEPLRTLAGRLDDDANIVASVL